MREHVERNIEMNVNLSRLQSTTILCVVAALVSVFANACGENPVSPTAVSGTGANLRVMLTAATD
jgi:hypothetical protein